MALCACLYVVNVHQTRPSLILVRHLIAAYSFIDP